MTMISSPFLGPSGASILFRELGLTDYMECFAAMQAFTENRTDETPDEIWFTEHAPVYTLGLAGDPGHMLQTVDIPLVKTDRGGQITYHGPGQLVAYILLDLKRRQLTVRDLVYRLEQAVIDTMAGYNLPVMRKPKAPGVYIAEGRDQGAKIAALGLKIRKGCSYHGLSLNVAMDLKPFTCINPCGYVDLKTIDMASSGVHASLDDVMARLRDHLILNLDTEKSL